MGPLRWSPGAPRAPFFFHADTDRPGHPLPREGRERPRLPRRSQFLSRHRPDNTHVFAFGRGTPRGLQGRHQQADGLALTARKQADAVAQAVFESKLQDRQFVAEQLTQPTVQ